MELINYGIAIGAGYTINLVIESVKKNIPIGVKAKFVSKSGILKNKIEPKVIEDYSISEFLKFGEFNKTIEKFQGILEQEFTECNLDAFYKNIKTLKIEQKDMGLYNKLKHLKGQYGASGYYSIGKNKIRTDDDNDWSYVESTLFHELLHMATTRRNSKTYFCGFKIRNKVASIGEGLNEGYTEFLTSCYFTRQRSYSYNSLQHMSSMIEGIVGGKFMKNAFFSNDLNAVINELAKYSSREKVIEIILKMDKLNELGLKDLNKRQKLENEIRCDIANIGINKNTVRKENGEFSEERYVASLYGYFLEANGMKSYFEIDENEKITNHRIFFSYEPHSRFIDLSDEQFMMLANEFYQSNGNKPLDTNKPFINKYGLTTYDTLNKLRSEKIFWYDRKVEDMDSFLLQQTKNSSSELDAMFINQNNGVINVNTDELEAMFNTDNTSNTNERNKSLNKEFNAIVSDSKTDSESKLIA